MVLRNCGRLQNDVRLGVNAQVGWGQELVGGPQSWGPQLFFCALQKTKSWAKNEKRQTRCYCVFKMGTAPPFGGPHAAHFPALHTR